MDTVSFRTLGGGAAHDPDLGARTPERHGHHDLAGSYGAWGSHLGFGSYDSRSKLHFALGGGSVPRKAGSGAPAFDQCCRIQRSNPDRTHTRIGRRLNGLEKNDEQHTSRKWNNGRSAYFHRTCLWFCHGPLPRLPRTKTNPPGVSANIVRNTQEEADRASVARRIDRTLKPIHRLFFWSSGRFTRDIQLHYSCLAPQPKSPGRLGRTSRSNRLQTRF